MLVAGSAWMRDVPEALRLAVAVLLTFWLSANITILLGL